MSPWGHKRRLRTAQEKSGLPPMADAREISNFFGLGPRRFRNGSRAVMLAASKSRQLCLRKETGARPAKSVAKGTTAVMARIASWIRRSQSRAAPILRERGDTPSKRSSLSSTGAEAGGSVDIS